MLTFVKHHTPQTSLAKKVLADLAGLNLKGNYLTGDTTLDDCEFFSKSVISEKLNRLSGNRTHAYHNDINVIREPTAVHIIIKGTINDKITPLCSFLTS